MKNQTSLDTGSELMLILGNPKKHCGPPIKVGAYEGRADEFWLKSDSQ